MNAGPDLARRFARRARERRRTQQVIDDLGAMVDQLRSGSSLRQAFLHTAQGDGSPFHPVASALTAGRPLAHALRDEAVALAQRGSGTDAELAAVYCVLAVHAQAGGDPTLACRALADRLARRAGARDEAHALTTQARLGARAILLLTPAFLLLVSVSDPRGIVSYITEPQTRVALFGGLLLQALGAIWIGRIVAAIGASSSSGGRVPVVRALRALLVGRLRPQTDDDCAQTAETIAFALDAGLSPTAALRTVAPFARGEFGDAVRHASDAVGVPVHRALAAAMRDVDGDAPERFVRAFAWSAELGVPLAEALRGVADDVRDAMSIRFTEDVRRASMRVLLPLGVLVLPAFVLACLVPLFVGGLRGIAS